MSLILRILLCVILISSVLSENKYTRSANEKLKGDVDFRNLEKPFRMNKLNLLWSKARQVRYLYFFYPAPNYLKNKVFSNF